MFLTKKRYGRIKARGCADGRKQRETTRKEDAAAPTAAIESVMLSANIDAMEERDVASVDIPGAFMQADIDEVAPSTEPIMPMRPRSEIPWHSYRLFSP
jgi:hypothetical protein